MRRKGVEGGSSARLVVTCPDQPGIVAAVSEFLFVNGANIVHSDQHSTDPWDGTFFLRIEFELKQIDQRIPALERAFQPIVQRFGMKHRFVSGSQTKNLAVFVSKEDHCLLELLWQARAGDLPGEIALVVSNHPDLEEVVEPFGIPFHYIPVEKDNRPLSEAHQLELIDSSIDLVVLARYMQIVSPVFIDRWPNKIVNIHHSFLPAFVGAKPYRQAYERGVKIIGATAHYVTSELDAGPIIEQDVQRVDHRSNTADLVRLGRQIERSVLARAVKWHLEDRVLVHGNRTVVFG